MKIDRKENRKEEGNSKEESLGENCAAGFSQAGLSKLTLILLLLLLNTIPSLYATAHFTLTGTYSGNYLGLKIQSERAASVSLSFDIGDYLRAGVTHRQSTNLLKGYFEYNNSNLYLYTTEETRSFANSIDLMFILYHGEIFFPYLQVGIVRKNYLIRKTIGDYVLEFPVGPHIVPNAGVGIGARLTRSFSLNMSFMVSESKHQEFPDEPPKNVFDSYISAGITYNL